MDQNYFLKKKKKRYQNFKSWVYTWTCMFFFVLFFFCPPHCEWLTILIQEYWISMYSSFSVCIKEKGENLILVCYLMVKSRPINCMLYVCINDCLVKCLFSFLYFVQCSDLWKVHVSCFLLKVFSMVRHFVFCFGNHCNGLLCHYTQIVVMVNPFLEEIKYRSNPRWW